MVHKQEGETRREAPRWYAFCSCGVCGPLRAQKTLAQDDDRLHAKVCSSKPKLKEAA
jgi:hypothetical protein